PRTRVARARARIGESALRLSSGACATPQAAVLWRQYSGRRDPRMTRFFPLLATILLTGCATPMASRQGVEPVTVGIVAINDFHGNIEPPRQSVPVTQPDGKVLQVPAGGGAWLASAVDSIRARYHYHLTVSAGDLIGG